MAKKLRYDIKDKKILYPKNIKEEHDKLVKLIEIKENKTNSKKLLKRFNQIKNNIFESDKYIVYPVKSVEELIDESNQQNNCVKTYVERIIEGKCDIYFMRLLEDKKHSLVTVEVKNNQVVQKRTKYNKETTKEQNKFLKLWERKILNDNN